MADAAFEIVYDEWVTIKTTDGMIVQVMRTEAGGAETDEDVFEDLFTIRGQRPVNHGKLRTIFEFTVTQTLLEDGLGLSADIVES